ncbi:MAG: nitrilase-related carbon-nitrogen hydrolase [Paludibacter sp.]|nr:nitrilase-related carbon-nitrogen hydrolase [Paludibacter sp.]
MKITLIQDTIHWADKAANLRKTEEQIAALSEQTDLVVLPEMFTTGFCADKLYLAENMEGETVKTLIWLAKQYKLAITGSFIALENQHYFNRAFFVFPNGKIETADKRHLFTMGCEQNYFSAGDKRLIVKYCGFNICLLVCYDVRFPVWARNVSNEYDLLIFVANFPEQRIGDWDILLKARAVENQAYTCGVNRVGVDGNGIHYNGHSALLNYQAKPLLTFAENETSIQTCKIDIEPLEHFRQKFAVWKDADRFEIKA